MSVGEGKASAGDVLRRAVAHHQRGELSLARGLYESILAEDASHADALHLLGVLHCQSGDAGVGVPLIERALSERPGQLDYYVNLGVVYQQQGDVSGETGVQERLLSVFPDHVGAQRRLFVLYRAAGDVSSALRVGQRLSELAPGDAVLQSQLGTVYLDAGDVSSAERCFVRSLELDSGCADAWINLGNVQQSRGDLIGATVSYERGLRVSPGHAVGWCNLGNAQLALGDHSGAEFSYRRSLELDPAFAEAHNNLGNALKASGAHAASSLSYRRALELQPGSWLMWNNLGNSLLVQGDACGALDSFERALTLAGEHAETLCNAGRACLSGGDAAKALDYFQRAVQKKPDYATALAGIGQAHASAGELQTALEHLLKAVALQPESGELHAAVANVQYELQMLEPSLLSYQRSLELAPDEAGTHNNLGNVFLALGQKEQAVQCFRRAVQLDGDLVCAAMQVVHQSQQLCSWSALDKDLDRIEQSLTREWSGTSRDLLSPFSMISLLRISSPQQQLQCARRWAQGVQKKCRESGFVRQPEQWGTAAAEQRPGVRDRLRIGYLSMDFRMHPVGNAIVEVLECHDRQRVEVFGYSYGPDDGSLVRDRIRRACDRFCEIGSLSHRAAAAQIAADGIDILVDLSGYTLHARTEILAYRPAPLQVNYLGYPGTLGADFMDYILVDDYIVPPDQQPYFTERLVHLPGCYLPNDSQLEIAATTPGRTECGLPEAGFVFCAFNNTYKITPQMFGVWMRLLQAVPDSVLWLRQPHPEVVQNLRREAKHRNVSGERLVFAATCRDQGDHLARYRHADLFLDTYPFNAHTTASDCLRMGVPLVTLSGDTFASRVAGSLLRAAGLSELITRSPAEYERVSLELATDGQRLQELRGRLRQGIRHSGLLDGCRTARDLEQAYQRMWQLQGGGQRPLAFRVEQAPAACDGDRT